MGIPLDEREAEVVKKYQRMKKVGATPHIVYRVMKYDGFWGLCCMKMLRTVFPELDLMDAKAVMVEGDEGVSLEVHFERLIPAIEAALDELEKEEDAPPS
ncbi:hypothetical protein EON83_16490 [bacterium]|nr:MAG: hypothetical protein EON83_16490 [bacterium]